MNGWKLLLCKSSTLIEEPSPSRENIRKNTFLIIFTVFMSHIKRRVRARGLKPNIEQLSYLQRPNMRKRCLLSYIKTSFIRSGVSLPNHVGCEMKQMAQLTGALLYRYTDKEAAQHNAIFAWACVYVRCRPSPPCVFLYVLFW